ncbi:MAG: hypothetical protein R3B06_31085 [Kofleriaceae bacterium]
MTAPPSRPPAPRPPPRRSLVRRVATIVTVLLFGIGVGVATALIIAKRLKTGTWQLPTRQDVAAARQQVVEAVAPPPPPPVSRIIFLDRRPRTLTAGVDDAAAGSSSVINHQGPAPRTVPGWKGTDKNWRAMVACVQRLFEPFDVEVTDQPPASREHVLVVVGGKPKDIGVADAKVAGLAPFSGGLIPRAVVFAFAATQSHRAQGVCETIGMEVAHAYGLDHAYLCSDVMSYLTPCGKRTFVDKAVACGEKKKRPCAGGKATQNSHQQLLGVLGPRRPAPTPPATGR